MFSFACDAGLWCVFLSKSPFWASSTPSLSICLPVLVTLSSVPCFCDGPCLCLCVWCVCLSVSLGFVHGSPCPYPLKPSTLVCCISLSPCLFLNPLLHFPLLSRLPLCKRLCFSIHILLDSAHLLSSQTTMNCFWFYPVGGGQF